MNIKTQHIILRLFDIGKYSVNHDGELLGKQGIIKPITHYTGNLQYNLDLGFRERIGCFAQDLVYLHKYREIFNPTFIIDHVDCDKSNNKPENIYCNLAAGRKNVIPSSVKDQIKADFESGITFVKLASKYKTTRQTIAKICRVIK